MNELLVLLLPLAAFSGWWIGKGDKKKNHHQRDEDYFQGLSYLLENETDKAIDIFVRIAHLDDSAIENQITLGSLFRHRGEIDRALHIHTALLNRKELSDQAKYRLYLALAEDYMQAGVMNHARDYLDKVTESASPAMRQSAQRRLIRLYENQGYWEKAISVAQALDPFRRDEIQKNVAHYHCELADEYLNTVNDWDKAEAQLLQALQCDKTCLRAIIQLGYIAEQRQNYVQAINQYQRIEKIAPAFIVEVYDNLQSCYASLHQQHEWENYLKGYVKRHQQIASLLHSRHSDWQIATDDGNEKAWLYEQLQKKPSLFTLQAYLGRLNSENVDIKICQTQLDTILSEALRYRCRECGFRGNRLNWQCPGCKNWGTFTPVTHLGVKEVV